MSCIVSTVQLHSFGVNYGQRTQYKQKNSTTYPMSYSADTHALTINLVLSNSIYCLKPPLDKTITQMLMPFSWVHKALS